MDFIYIADNLQNWILDNYDTIDIPGKHRNVLNFFEASKKCFEFCEQIRDHRIGDDGQKVEIDKEIYDEMCDFLGLIYDF